MEELLKKEIGGRIFQKKRKKKEKGIEVKNSRVNMFMKYKFH